MSDETLEMEDLFNSAESIFKIDENDISLENDEDDFSYESDLDILIMNDFQTKSTEYGKNIFTLPRAVQKLDEAKANSLDDISKLVKTAAAAYDPYFVSNGNYVPLSTKIMNNKDFKVRLFSWNEGNVGATISSLFFAGKFAMKGVKIGAALAAAAGATGSTAASVGAIGALTGVAIGSNVGAMAYRVASLAMPTSSSKYGQWFWSVINNQKFGFEKLGDKFYFVVRKNGKIYKVYGLYVKQHKSGNAKIKFYRKLFVTGGKIDVFWGSKMGKVM